MKNMRAFFSRGLFFIGILNSLVCCAMEPNNHLFEKLSQKAEEKYQKSNDEKKQQEPMQKETTQDVVQQEEKKGLWSLMHFFQSESKPILSRYTEFSPEWWQALFKNCKGCKNSEEKIDCTTLLKDNKSWQEVAVMRAEVKQVVMKRALKNITEENGPCNLACALCAGGDPNERMELKYPILTPHTALHTVSGELELGTTEVFRHYGLFQLLLEKGADVNLKCAPNHPLEFYIDETWKEELRKRGSARTLR